MKISKVVLVVLGSTTMIMASASMNGLTNEYLLPGFIRFPLLLIGLFGITWYPLHWAQNDLRVGNKKEETK